MRFVAEEDHNEESLDLTGIFDWDIWVGAVIFDWVQ